MTQPLTLAPAADAYELRGGAEIVGRIVPHGADTARAVIGAAHWELAIEGDRDALAATWQVVARDERGDEAGRYFHGSMRGGRVRIGERWASLRRELGLGSEWRLRVKPDAALTLRPVPDGAALRLDIAFVPGSADVPALLLLLVCWSILLEEAGPARLSR